MKKKNNELAESFIALSALVSKLRGPDGCPWDKQQTDSTVKTYLLEEACEVLDAVERNRPEDVCQELGDLLFQIIFLAVLAEERNEFDLSDVIDQIQEKMIRRHPHVFGQMSVTDAEEVSQNWERIKDEEKKAPHTTEALLQAVPVSLPSLLRAHRLSQRAAKVGFDWETKGDVWNKVKEEMGELEKALSNQDTTGVQEEMGDLLFSLVNLARHLDLNAENLLREANQKFIMRFQEMERELHSMNLDLQKATPAEMNQVWDRIKTGKK
ncbi:MAG: nucleoside triphosphate pyrophosphohydrolase [Deltaproteobacteria bacterium]|nr:nucleoside triphosphate pyrophosphohydrolase [Deltaproteobacteria bacterium]